MSLSDRWCSGGWFRMPAEVWPEALEALRAAGPLSEAAVRADVGWLLDRLEHHGDAWPSTLHLARRWGWGRKRARLFLARTDPLEQQKGQSGASQGPVEGHSGASQRKVEPKQLAKKGQSGASQGPVEGQSGATRALGTDTDTDTDTDTTSSQLALTATAAKPDPWMLLLEHLAAYRPSAKTWDRTKNNGRALSTLLKRHGLEDAKRIVTLAHTSPELAYLRRRRSDGAAKYPDVSTMYRHGGTWLENCADTPSAIARDRPSWEALCAWHDAGCEPGETRRFLSTLPGGWERWQAFLSPRMREKHARTYAQLGGQ